MANWVLYAGLLAVFAGIVGVVATTFVGTERAGVARSLAAVEAISSAPDHMRRELEKPFNERVTGPFFSRLTDLGRRFTPADQSARLRRKLDLAGNPTGWDTDRVLAFKMLGLLVGGAAGFIVPLLFGNVLWALVFGVGLAALGLFAPNLVLYQKAYDRSARITRELPDALDLLVISVESGLGFDAALSQVARNTDGPLADEFFRVLQEMQLGTGRADASPRWCRRTPSAYPSPTCCASRLARCASVARSAPRRLPRRCR
jgi:tight adherence protein C